MEMSIQNAVRALTNQEYLRPRKEPRAIPQETFDPKVHIVSTHDVEGVERG